MQAITIGRTDRKHIVVEGFGRYCDGSVGAKVCMLDARGVLQATALVGAKTEADGDYLTAGSVCTYTGGVEVRKITALCNTARFWSLLEQAGKTSSQYAYF